MIDSLVELSNVRVAGNPTFFPHPTDAKKHRCLLTVIKNRGKNTAGAEMRDEFGLVFWGKYAQTAALHLDKGRAINVQGVLRSYTVDTGRIKPNGKKELNRTTSVHVKSFEFSADSKKALIKRINGNMAAIQAAKDAGRRDPNAIVTAEELIAIQRPQAYDYNPQLAAQTGRYGNANVFIKGQGFLGAGANAGLNGNAGVPVGTPVAGNADAQIANMEAQIAELKAANAAGGAVNPF